MQSSSLFRKPLIFSRLMESLQFPVQRLEFTRLAKIILNYRPAEPALGGKRGRATAQGAKLGRAADGHKKARFLHLKK